MMMMMMMMMMMKAVEPKSAVCPAQKWLSVKSAVCPLTLIDVHSLCLLTCLMTENFCYRCQSHSLQ